ncbi:extracellular solute-binding protein [Bacillaceae bacterium SIJ1]|nr:extracellular solute-binding protein [Litoribacterium kuwaitense]
MFACSLMVFLAACSSGSNSTDSNASSNTGDSSSEEPKQTLKILTAVAGGKNAEEHELFVQEIEKALDMDVEMVKPPSDYDQKLLASFASGEVYDVVYLTKDLMDVLVSQEALMPLTDQIAASDVLSDSAVIPDEEWDMIAYENDELYGVFNKSEGSTMPIVRQDWLDELGLEEPTTLDEFYDVFKAFGEQDPDGNGKDDTYGLTTAGLYDIQPFMSAAGVKYKYVIDENGNRTIPYASEDAVPVYEWFNQLYDEGLLDPNFATNDTAQMRDLFLSDRVGVVTYWDAWVGLFNNLRLTEDPNTAFEAKGIAGAEGPNGVMLRRGDPSLWAIPANSSNPEGALAFLEYWHSEEGNLLSTLGIEGHDYEVDENGEVALTPTGEEHGMDHGVVMPNNTNFENPVGFLPGFPEAREVWQAHNATLETSTEDWPDAEKIVENYAFQAMTGELPAEEAVQKMQEELKGAGLID